MHSRAPFSSHQDIFSKDVISPWMGKCTGKGLKERASHQEGPSACATEKVGTLKLDGPRSTKELFSQP